MILISLVIFFMFLAIITSVMTLRRENKIRKNNNLIDFIYTHKYEICVVCNRPTMYSLHGKPLHPSCRKRYKSVWRKLFDKITKQ